MGYIYGAISVCLIVCAWLFVPDCRGRSLEDINRLFESNIPARRFHRVTLEHAASGNEEMGLDGGIILVEKDKGKG